MSKRWLMFSPKTNFIGIRSVAAVSERAGHGVRIGFRDNVWTQLGARAVRGAALLATAITLQACSELPKKTVKAIDVPPLKIEGRIYTPEEAIASIPTLDVLAMSPEMHEFVEKYTGSSNNARNKLLSLHMAIKSPAALDISYDPFADGDARTAFERGTANCLSYAHLFVALAREAGLNARYQWMEVRPEWHRIGGRVAVRLHVNVQVKMRDGSEYLVDIDPLNSTQVAGARIMSDDEGLALYYNNLAMMALAQEETVRAWRLLVKGLEISPELPQLWVNLGTIYRYSQQYAEAELTYFNALDIDRGDRSAMNNLVVLYEAQGMEDEQNYWLDRMRRYRDLNPYYHANLGELAMKEERWEEAYEHFRKARKLHPDDGQLSYSLGLAAHRLGRDNEAKRMIAKAIDMAAFQVEKERYRIQLRAIEEKEQAAVL